MNPIKVKPSRDWCLVLHDKRVMTLKSGLVLPLTETTTERLSQGSGLLVRLGNGDKIKALGLIKGLRVVFRTYLRHLNPVYGDDIEPWDDGSEKRYFLIHVDDLIAVSDQTTDFSPMEIANV